MKLIVGLGNPGTKYSRTRHNVGFIVADEIAKSLKLAFKDSKPVESTQARSEEFVIAKPTTFMNNSGRAVVKLLKQHDLSPFDLVVVYDDVDLDFGKLRYRETGASGGHKGMQSLIDALGTKDIARIKVGVGRHDTLPTDAYVLSPFTATELKFIKELAPEIFKLIEEKG